MSGLGASPRGLRPTLVRAAILAGGLSLLAAGCGSPGRGQAAAPAGQQRPATAASRVAPPPASPTPTASVRTGQPTVIPVPPPPGGRHQTRTVPSAGTRVFRAEMTDLWAAVVTGQARLAAQAFFPLAAYTQVKAIADPASDWQNRLWYDFTLDVTAAHAAVGRGATFVRVIAPSALAVWVSPGACYNSAGYWHLPGPRVVYEQGGETRSFGIASLISWRGDWYVVHFGAVLRGGAYGEVDDPETGPGEPGPPGGC